MVKISNQVLQKEAVINASEKLKVIFWLPPICCLAGTNTRSHWSIWVEFGAKFGDFVCYFWPGQCEQCQFSPNHVQLLPKPHLNTCIQISYFVSKYVILSQHPLHFSWLTLCCCKILSTRLFPPIFWGWKLESANFFAFWLYDIIYIYYWVSQYSKYPIWDALPSPFMNKDREKAGGINICRYQYSTAHKYGINIYVNINIVLLTCTTSIYVNIVLLAWLRGEDKFSFQGVRTGAPLTSMKMKLRRSDALYNSSWYRMLVYFHKNTWYTWRKMTQSVAENKIPSLRYQIVGGPEQPYNW